MKIGQYSEAEVKENLELLNEYASKSEKWRRNSFLMEGARYGQHYSQDEYEQMLIMRVAPLSISVSTAICDSAEALFLQNKPAPKVAPLIFPFDEQRQLYANDVAQLFEFLITKDFQTSFGSLQLDRILKDQSNVGRGVGQVIPVFENGEFFTQFNRLPWRYYFPDPASTGEFYEDSESQLYAFPMSQKAAYRYLRKDMPELTWKEFEENFVKGNCTDKMNLFYTDDKYLLGGTKGNLLFVNRMTLEEETVYKIIPKAIINSEDADSLNFPAFRYKTALEVTEEMEIAANKGLIEIREERGIMLAHHTSVGNMGRKTVFPLKNYTTVPLVYDSRDNAFPYGRMWYIYSPQRAVNKYFISTLLNMSLLNSTRILAEEDSIINEDQWIRSSSQPGAILKYRLPSPGFSKAPEIVKPTPFDQTGLLLPKFLVYIMEYVSGMFGIMQGDASKAPDVFSTVASLQAAGGAKIKRRQGDIDVFLSKVGKVQAEMYQNYAPPQGYGSTITKEGKSEYRVFNKINLKKDVDENGETRYSAAIDPATDLSSGIKDVIYTSQSSAGYETATQALALTTLATQLSTPELIPDILRLYNFPGVSDSIAKIEARNDLSSRNQQLQMALKNVEGKSQMYQNQIFQLVRNLEQVRAKGKADTILNELNNIISKVNEGMQNA